VRVARNLSVGTKLYGAFALVAGVFLAALVATLALDRSAQDAWRHTRLWDKAVAGSQLQIRGTRQQASAQALYVATFDPRYKAEWEEGVALGDRGTAAVQKLGDPVIARIASSANEADHNHDASVHDLLFPAVARRDKAASLAALEKADRFVRVPLAAQEKIASRIETLRTADIRHAQSLQSKAAVVGVILAVAALVLASILAFLIARAIRRPLLAVKRAAEAVAAGDLGVVVAVDSGDELGDTAQAFQTMVENVRAIVGRVAETAGRLGSSSQQMSSTAEEAGRAVGEIAGSVGDVAKGADRQARVVEQARATTDEAAAAARSGAASAAETTSAAEKARAVSAGAFRPSRARRRRCAPSRTRRPPSPTQSARSERSPSRSAGSSRRSPASPGRRTSWR
jgi:methyl-accepting chemotaxis protein